VTLTQTAVDFGIMSPSLPGFTSTNNTLTGPAPFTYNNTGNVDVNISVRADVPLWTEAPLNTEFFQYADQGTSLWVPFTASYVHLFENLTIGTLRNLEINVTVPLGEPATDKNATISVLGVSIE